CDSASACRASIDLRATSPDDVRAFATMAAPPPGTIFHSRASSGEVPRAGPNSSQTGHANLYFSRHYTAAFSSAMKSPHLQSEDIDHVTQIPGARADCRS